MISVLHIGPERCIRMQTHCRKLPCFASNCIHCRCKKTESSDPMARHMTLCPLKCLTMLSESCSLAPAFLGTGHGRKEQTICWRTTNGHHYSCVPITLRTEQFPTSSSERRLTSAQNGPPLSILTSLPRHIWRNGTPFFSKWACCIIGGNLLNLIWRHGSLYSLQHLALAC